MEKYEKGVSGKLFLVQPDGKFIVESQDVLVRYNLDGTRDMSLKNKYDIRFLAFNETFINSWRDYKSGFLQGDGKIVGVGEIRNDFAVARYNSNGTLDTGFGIGGKVITHFYGKNCRSTAYTGVVLPNGNIVAAGQALEGYDYTTYFALAQYKENGTLDTDFGTRGVVKTRFSEQGDSFIKKVLVQSDGKIIAVGQFNNTIIALVRYNQDGALDTSFGSAGIVTIGGGLVEASDITAFLRQDGHIVVPVKEKESLDIGLVCYDQDGVLDATFGYNGKIVVGGIERGITFSDDGSMVAGVSGDDRLLYVYDIKSGKKIAEYLLSAAAAINESDLWVPKILFCQNGKSLLVNCGIRGEAFFVKPRVLIIHLPVEKINEVKFLNECFDKEQYLYRALISRVQEVGRKLTGLSLPEELEVMFDRLPRHLQDKILTPEGRIKRELARDVEGIYRRVRTMFGIDDQHMQKAAGRVVSGVAETQGQSQAVPTVDTAEVEVPGREQVD